MDISGGGNEHIFPRSSPFPYPPHICTISDQYFRQQRPDIWFAAPTARSNGGARNHCCANGVCNLCPVDAKFSIMNGISAFERPNARLVLGAEVTAVHIQGGQAKGVEVVTSEGRRVELRADTVALGANALYNAAILMRSDIKSAALGRYIHEQIAQEVSVDIPIKNYYGGTSITGHCYGLYDGAHRRENGAVLIENYNAPSHIRTEIGKWTQRLHLKFIVEDLPQAQNRVVLTEAGAPRILWAGHSEYAFKGLEFARENLASVMPVEVEALHAHPINATEAHIQGTHRMGTDPQTSVVDPYLRTHAAQNLFALGAGAFPSCSPANPTLTLSALSLRAGGAL
jgi:choline dehydrogenase-like flavoprotein